MKLHLVRKKKKDNRNKEKEKEEIFFVYLFTDNFFFFFFFFPFFFFLLLLLLLIFVLLSLFLFSFYTSGCLVHVCFTNANCSHLYDQSGLDLIVDASKRHPTQIGLQKYSGNVSLFQKVEVKLNFYGFFF